MTTENIKNIAATSVEKAEQFFTKEQVIREIVQIAEGIGIRTRDLQLTPEKESHDSAGNLTYLSIKATPECARRKEEGSISYQYLLKGKHESGESESTIIMISYGSMDAPQEVYFSKIVAEVRGGEFVKL